MLHPRADLLPQMPHPGELYINARQIPKGGGGVCAQLKLREPLIYISPFQVINHKRIELLNGVNGYNW